MREDIQKKEFLVPSDLSLVHTTSAGVLAFLKPLRLGQPALFDLRLCVEEALINAIKYGHKERKELKVLLTAEYNDREIRVRVEDQGGGFDPKQLVNCTKGGNLFKNCGRGVYLIQKLMDEVCFNKKGNAILMVKRITQEAGKKS